MVAYWRLFEAKQQGGRMMDARKAMAYDSTYSPEVNALCDWLEMICMENWPVTSVENRRYRNMRKHKHTFSYKRIVMTIFLLTEVVQDEITNRIKNARGIIIADGLSRGGTHYEATMYAYVKDEGKAEARLDILLILDAPRWLPVRRKRSR